jgi:hypothetical protein
VIEAGRRGCGKAVLVIHEFVSPDALDGETDAQIALRQFLTLLGDDADPYPLRGPFALRSGGSFIPVGVQLFIGRIVTATPSITRDD